MDLEWKDMLACPKCTQSLSLQEERQELHCHACLLCFSVIRGLPNMVINEAKPLGAPQGGPHQESK